MFIMNQPTLEVEQAPTLSRLELFARVFNWAESAALVSVPPIIPSIKAFSDIPGFPDIAKKIWVDEPHKLSEGGSLRNIGSAHIQEVYNQNKQLLEDAIRDCDVLLIESIEGEHFFKPLKDFALQSGKKVVMIDDVRVLFIVLSTFFLPSMAGAALAMEQRGDEILRREFHQPLRIFHMRRNIMRAIAAVTLGLQTLTGIFSMNFSENPASYEGYFIRGRSASMFKHAESVMSKDQGKRYLSISGIVHAQLFEYYLKHPEEFDKDLKNYALHYFVFGEGKQEVTE